MHPCISSADLELALDPGKTDEIDRDAVAAAREFMRMAEASGL
jgi:hypothetical protein